MARLVGYRPVRWQLAQRSATAAKEIKELIGDSVNRVDTGSRLVDERAVRSERSSGL